MSDIFFEQLKLKKPDYNLNINTLSHGAMTGRMLEKIEERIQFCNPDCVLVYGDTNSTLAGALAAKKLHRKIAHIEAGLRSFNMKMPEEINRILTDRMSDFLFCPTDTAVKNLKSEGFENFESIIFRTGDVMKDSALFFSQFSKKPSIELPYKFIVCTLHREENTNDINNLTEIFNSFEKISKEIPIILPIHPRTQNIIKKFGIGYENILNLHIIEPLGYLEMLYLLKNCSLVMTDSGGLQKEAYFFDKPAVVLREETEWIEITKAGANILAGSDKNRIYAAFQEMIDKKIIQDQTLFGNGNASSEIVNHLLQNL